jgi:hypothetical protein
MFGLCDDCGDVHDRCIDCQIYEKLRDDMRRYLYRNVACEARKASDIARHLPNIPGWS